MLMEYANLAQVLHRQAQRLGPRVALRYKRYGLYHDFSWQCYRDEALAGAAALVDVGIRPGDRVGLVAENSLDWLVADMAILTAGAVNVSPHPPLTARQIHYQLHDAEVCWAIVSNAVQLDKLRSIRGELPALRVVVVFDHAAAGADAIAWDGFRQRGRAALSRLRSELDRREEALGPDDLATVMYTSGTTGNPKGVMLTHGNLVSNTLASLAVQPHDPDDIILSWLPYTHIYARTVDHYLSMAAGVTLAIAESAEKLVDNLAEIEPTHMASVPRFYEKVLNAVACDDPVETGKRLRRIFGRRIDWLSSGGAPLPMPIAQAFLAAGLKLMQGYGLTETSPVISFNSKADNKLGTVGRPLPGVEVRIAADGEVLTRGPHVMKGYWKNPQATAETIKNGWLHTGDLGSLDADGFLSITGRKKELMVLSNGKKVVPSHLEGLLAADPCIDQAVVCGEGRNYLTALLVPHWGNVKETLAARGVTLQGEAESWCRHPAVVELLMCRCRSALADLSHMEQIKKITVLSRPFTVENDELTVSLKLRRNVVLCHYGERVEELYREGLADEPEGEPAA
jgi:long-chain acyl-CoA synthetase